jgi:ADP-heptose:LPS heptosyltransferase
LKPAKENNNPVIFIFRTGGIGDVILSTVSIRIIYQNFPSAKIVWFGRQSSLALIKYGFPQVQIHELPASYISFFKLISRLEIKPDVVIDLQRSARTIILGKYVSLKFFCAYFTWNKYSLRRSFMVFQTRLKKRSSLQARAEKNLPNRFEAMARCVVRALNNFGPANLQNTQPHFSFDGIKNNSVAICLGALFESKSLPAEKVRSIIQHIARKNTDSLFIFLGDENQQQTAEKIIARLDGSCKTKNLCGKTSLTEVATILSSSSFALANDSALAHLSESVKTPVIMFFGPTHENFGYRPYLKNSLSFSANLSCRPCTKDGNTTCRYGDYKCLKEVELDPVYDHANFLLSQSQ